LARHINSTLFRVASYRKNVALAGDVPPAELEARYQASQQSQATKVGLN
jgi:hypothetical protein